jgi:hypothetical protein
VKELQDTLPSGCSGRVSVNQLMSILNWLATLEFLLPKPLYGIVPITNGNSSINFLAPGM